MNHKCNIPSTPHEVCYVHDFTWGTKFHKPLNASGQIIMFHQPRFPWNKMGFPSSATFWVEVVWGRNNLTKCICHMSVFLVILVFSRPWPLLHLASAHGSYWDIWKTYERTLSPGKRTLQWFACGTLKWWIRNQSQIHKTYQQQQIALCLIFFWLGDLSINLLVNKTHGQPLPYLPVSSQKLTIPRRWSKVNFQKFTAVWSTNFQVMQNGICK